MKHDKQSKRSRKLAARKRPARATQTLDPVEFARAHDLITQAAENCHSVASIAERVEEARAKLASYEAELAAAYRTATATREELAPLLLRLPLPQ
jgi:hypothetical protein